ncbi:hypothetical protein ACQ4PT_054877 [Festuca glaucescens]
MAATTPGGGDTERGGASPYSGAGVPDVSAGGVVISSDVTDSRSSMEARAASAFARAVISSPAKSRHRWASPLGGVELDDDIWDIRFNILCEDNLERNVSQSDIRVLNLLAMIECYGYGIRDIMYFVKEKGKGLTGMEVIDSMAKVEEMLALYEAGQCVNITVLTKNSVWPAGLNVEADEAVLHDVHVRLSVDSDGVNYISDDEEIPVAVAVDYSDVMYVGTQQSCNIQKCKQVVPLSDDDDAFFYPCQYKPEEHNIKVAEELELMRELKRQKLAKEHDPEVAEIMEKMNRQKRQRDDPYMHYEGDTDVEEVFEDEEEDSDGDEAPEPDYFEKKQPMRPGPTSRCHHEVVEYQSGDFIPSTDEESSLDDLGDSDDDGFIKKLTLASGKKRKLKKMKKRNCQTGTVSALPPLHQQLLQQLLLPVLLQQQPQELLQHQLQELLQQLLLPMHQGQLQELLQQLLLPLHQQLLQQELLQQELQKQQYHKGLDLSLHQGLLKHQVLQDLVGNAR